MANKPYAVGRGRCVIALLADPDQPLIDRHLVDCCAESCRNWKAEPTFCNAVPYWMRPGDVVHVHVTDLLWMSRMRPHGDYPTGNTPHMLRELLAADRGVPQMHLYVNRAVVANPSAFYRTVCHELAHFFLSRFEHNPDPQYVSHEPPGPWQSWAEMDAISANSAVYYDNLTLTARPGGARVDWPDRPNDGRWDVVGLWPEGSLVLPGPEV